MKNRRQTAAHSVYGLRALTGSVLMLLLVLAGCKNQQPPGTAIQVVPDTTVVEEPQNLPPARPKYPYRPSVTRAFDLLHTRLEVSFDWENSQMPAEARLRMSPWFFPRNTVKLDARAMQIDRVALFDGGTLRDLPYSYDNVALDISLDRTYTREETLEVYIKYTARPEMIDSLTPEGGHRDKGLYFINPRGETPNKPRQIWTQGESYGSSAWFPTFEQTNERCTQEIYMTVADSFTTLSNGILVNSTDAGNGKRTDYWRMSLPHAPYLFAMAVGEFAVVRDEWRGKEVSYYVEPEYEQYARLIFGKTPAMLEYFSNLLGVEYPWEKYSQIVVRDFVSGAMENTTATIHMGALQHDARQHVDNTYEDYISHELFHQWFGDLVTCESWANLTLNEGFATYGEFLWLEHDAGHDEAIRHLLGDRLGYLYEARRKQVPLIRFHHRHADDLFDGHSYQKGGQVLHMLRKVVGDEAFFASLKHYLAKHAYTDVEIHELRMAFEEVTGQDMHWFFDQWFLQAGHPVLEIERAWRGGNFYLKVRQNQDFSKYPVFRFPVVCEMVTDTGREELTLWMENHDTTFVIPTSMAPLCFIFNSDAALLAEIGSDNNEEADWLAQLKFGAHYGQLSEAMNGLEAAPPSAELREALIAVTEHPHYGARGKALESLMSYSGPGMDRVFEAAQTCLSDKEASVRREAVNLLDNRYDQVAEHVGAGLKSKIQASLARLTNDSSYAVQAAALRTLYTYDTLGGQQAAERFLDSPPPNLVGTLARILREQDSPKYLDFVERQYAQQTRTRGRAGTMAGLDDYLQAIEGEKRVRGIRFLMKVAENDDAFYPRYVAGKYLVENFMEDPGVRDFISKMVDQESVQMMKEYYKKALE